MILTHKTRYCQIGKTRILRAPVFKHHIRNISPYKVYADNIEMFDAFADTVANFSPISMNIVDYWNKSMKTHDTYVWIPKEGVVLAEIKDPAFGWRKSENHGFRNLNVSANPDGTDKVLDDIKGGWPVETGSGRLLGEGRRSYIQGENEREDGSCMDNHQRFFINPLIGVQDKLALTYLNNFYSVYYKARQNPTLRHRLLNIAKEKGNDLDASTFFNRPNNLFTEEKTVANKTFIMKKGTPIGLRYAQHCAFDAELQGPMSYFFMNIKTPKPLEYAISSNILEDLFEKFVKPLAHPIGFIYDYKAVCRVLGAEDVDHPMINYQVTSKRIEVNCLCKKEIIHKNKFDDVNYKDKHGVSMLDGLKDVIGQAEESVKHEIRCGGEFQPKPKVFALSEENIQERIMPDPDNPGQTITKKYLPGLWDGIAQDAWGVPDEFGVHHFNILKDYKNSYGLFRGDVHEFKRYTFENDNYLIAWTIQSKVQDEAPQVVIEYYRIDFQSLTGWTKVVTFENDVHCNVADNLSSKRESQITEEFAVTCVPTQNGPFIMDVIPTDPNASGKNNMNPITKGDNLGTYTDAQGVTTTIIKFRGFMVDPKTNTDKKAYGGKLLGWSILRNPLAFTKIKKP